MAGKFSDVRKYVQTKIQNEWIETQYVFDNLPAPKTDAEWIRVTMQTGAGISVLQAGKLGIGRNAITRHVGLITADINTPINTGGDRNDDIAQAFADMFSSDRLDENTVTYAAQMRRIGEETPWFTQIVEIEFRQDQRKT